LVLLGKFLLSFLIMGLFISATVDCKKCNRKISTKNVCNILTKSLNSACSFVAEIRSYKNTLTCGCVVTAVEFLSAIYRGILSFLSRNMRNAV